MSNGTSAPAPAGGSAVTTEQKKTWKQLLEENKAAFKEALPKVGLTPGKMIQIVSTNMRMNPELKKCTPASVISCMLQACELGLSPSNTLGMAYLVPFNNTKKGVKECTIMIGYKGLLTLARRSGDIRAIRAEVAYEKEPFQLPSQLGEQISHTVLAPKERGGKIGVFAEAALKDGGYQYIFLWADEVEALRKRSKAKDSGPWVTDEEEMWKKTAVRKLCKMLPMSVEDARAIADEEYRELGLDGSDLGIEDDRLPKGEQKENLEDSVKTIETTAIEVKDEGKKDPAAKEAGQKVEPPTGKEEKGKKAKE